MNGYGQWLLNKYQKFNMKFSPGFYKGKGEGTAKYPVKQLWAMEDSLSLFEDAVHYLDISGNLKIIKETAWKFKKLAMVRACLSVYRFTSLISLHLYDNVFSCSIIITFIEYLGTFVI